MNTKDRPAFCPESGGISVTDPLAANGRSESNRVVKTVAESPPCQGPLPFTGIDHREPVGIIFGSDQQAVRLFDIIEGDLLNHCRFSSRSHHLPHRVKEMEI